MSSWTTIFLIHSLKHKEKLGIHEALQFLGDLFLAQDDRHTAISLFTVALEGFTYMDVHRSKAECLLRLGDISKGQGNLLKAVELWETARPLFERSSQTEQVGHVDERLARVSEEVLGQHRTNLTCLAGLNAPSGPLEHMNNPSEIQELEGLDVHGEKEHLVTV
jgi:tetratricopeptide (TPR) repeat protein